MVLIFLIHSGCNDDIRFDLLSVDHLLIYICMYLWITAR